MTTTQPAPLQLADVSDELGNLVAAIDKEMSSEWTCASYHPSLPPALEAARAILALRPAQQATRIWINHDLRDVSVHEQDDPGWVAFDVDACTQPTQPAQAAQVPADVQQLVARAKKLAKGNKVDDYRAALADIGRAMLTAAQQGADHG